METSEYALRKYINSDYNEVVNKGLVNTEYLSKYLNKGIYSVLKLLKIYKTDLYVFYNINTDEIIGATTIRYKFNLSNLKLEAWFYGGELWADKRGLGLGKLLWECRNEIVKQKHRFVFLIVKKIII